ncbi:cytochrome P450, family 71, subfamily A, polypeptide 25 [Hibiscus trionum]|uniref:Cytochrome P450, family 71, subfamily A, polypeptide 25 n=1 Tax=Hibiscus trionum TaxID=183268 RepID=A0A9W7IRF0_HIBTR|nr:cytochrome P450, family 71, subfamily A, polypeptide 25 [Hibiscus trionum]
MELSIAKLSNDPLFLSLLLLLLPLIIWLWLKLQANGRQKLNLPPSPPKLPLIGNIHQLGKLPHRSLRNLSKKYGSLLLLQLGQNQTLVVSSADMVKEIVKNHDIAFSDRPRTTAANILLYGCTDVGFAPYGEYWRQARKICVTELLSLQRVNSFQFVRDEEVEVAVDRLRRASFDREAVNLSELLMLVANNVVSRSALSRKFESEDGKSKFGLLARRVLVLMTSSCVGDMFPYLNWIDYVRGFTSSLKQVNKEMDAIFDQIIEENENSNNNDRQRDFLSIILKLQQDGLLDMDLTLDNIKAFILDMLVGGTDTSSTTLEWVMAELMKNPTAMKKLQKEIRGVVGDKTKIDMNDVNQMDYLKCVIKEALRLHPAVPLLLPRQTTSKVNLGGYEIPPDVTVFFNVWAIHMDPGLWEKPEEFIPERFENSSADFKGQDFEYLPFGFGRRGCPGMAFAVAFILYTVANLLCWFDWEFTDGENAENLDMDEVYGLTAYKKVPLRLMPILTKSD